MGTSSATVASLLLLAAPAAAFSITPSASASRRHHTMPPAAAFSIAPSAFSSRRHHTMTMEIEEEATTTTAPRSMDAAEEKAIRKARIGFGGYPPGAYYELVQTDKPAAYDLVRKDYPELAGWSDDEIADACRDMRPNAKELIVDSPIGPFLVLSAISILRDGLGCTSGPLREGAQCLIEPVAAFSFLKIQWPF